MWMVSDCPNIKWYMWMVSDCPNIRILTVNLSLKPRTRGATNNKKALTVQSGLSSIHILSARLAVNHSYHGFGQIVDVSLADTCYVNAA